MTAPTGAPDPALHLADAPPSNRPRRGRRWAGLKSELLLALAVAVGVAALGAPLGRWVWPGLAPRVQVLMTERGPVHLQPEPEGYVAGESWYILIGLVAGILAAVLV